MNILFLSHIWPPAIDGGSQIIWRSLIGLKKLGHNTLVLTTNCSSTDDFIKPNSTPINISSNSVIRLPVFKTKLFIYLKKLFKFNIFNLLATGPIFKPLSFIKALTKIARFKPDLIMAGPLPTTIIPYALFLKKLYNTNLLTLPCFHQYDQSFQNPIFLNCLLQSDLIWTLTHHEAKYLKNNLKVPKAIIFTLYPGIPDNFPRPTFKPKPKGVKLLFLGSFSAHKRIELLLSAFCQINSKYPQSTLTIAGQKTLYYPQIKKHLMSLPKKYRNNITITAKKYTQLQLKKYLDQSSLLVNPSIHESFGLVFLEAASRGIPIIGSDLPPVVEIIKKSQAGLTFQKDNQKDLVNKIQTIINNPKLANKFCQNGIKFSQGLTWTKTIKKLNKYVS